MELFIGQFFIMYVLFPLLGIILVGIMFFIAKKNELLSNKKLIFYILVSSLIISLPALLGFIDYWFMPYAYVSLQIVYFFLGWYNIRILSILIKRIEKKPYFIEFCFCFTIMLFGAALFSLVFNLCNELQYGLSACTCVFSFIFPSIFRKAFYSFMSIPLEVYKIWSYSGEDYEIVEGEFTDENKTIVVELELYRNIADMEPLKTKVKATEDMPFGALFKMFITDYNKKYPSNPIEYNDLEDSFGWIFYTTGNLWGRKKYIDPSLSFVLNRLKKHPVIIAKRTEYQEE